MVVEEGVDGIGIDWESADETLSSDRARVGWAWVLARANLSTS
jgi:hypothetical protein